MSVDFIMQGVTMALVIYFGLHLWTQLRTVKSTVEAQKTTIEAQAEQMKAQSTVLQDFERLNKLMQQVIDTVDAPAMIERWQKYKLLVDIQSEQELAQRVRHETHEITTRLTRHLPELVLEAIDRTTSRVTEDMTKYFTGVLVGHARVIGHAMRFIPPDLRMALIDTSELDPGYKELLQNMADAAPYLPIEKLSTENPFFSQPLSSVRPLSSHFHRNQEAP